MIERDPKELAKQLEKYADSVTAFSLIESIAFAFGLGNKDFRQALLLTAPFLIPLMWAVGYSSFACVLYSCHRGEDEIVGKPDNRTAVGKWTTRIRIGRYLTVFGASMFNIVTWSFTKWGFFVVYPHPSYSLLNFTL